MNPLGFRRGLGLLAAAGTAATLFAATPADAATFAPAVHTVGHSASGTTFTLVQGRTLRIDLRTEVDGGYQWVMTHRPNKAKVEIVKHKLTPYKHKAHVVGYPYHTIYLLKGHRTGTTRITLVERQGTSKANPAERFTLRIHVVAPTP
jgi:predicted secreted protein